MLAVGSGSVRGQNRRMTQISSFRLHSPLDRLLVEAQRALDTVFGNPPAERPNPAADTPTSHWNRTSVATPPA